MYNRYNNNRGRRPFNSGGRSRGRSRFGESIDPSLFVKKAKPMAETPVYTPSFQFEELNISQVLKQNIKSKNYLTPTPIQDKTIKHILDGKDLLGVANTGTGKTAAFLIPLIDMAIRNPNKKTLIIVPTRELAVQISDELYSFTNNLRIYSVECIGGTSMYKQIQGLQRGAHFVIGTPGRLKDLSNRGKLYLKNFSTVVLDEVDRMLDMGFIDDVKTLVSTLPEQRQSLFFSATVDYKVEQIMKMILKNDHLKVSVTTGKTADHIEQDVVTFVSKEEKLAKLENILKDTNSQKVLIFVNTKRGVDSVHRHLYTKQFVAGSIHGDKRQNERQRTIDGFKSGKLNILIATDVAARGLDINGVTHVINYDIPSTYDNYVHRIGRTGRADKSGIALTFVERRF